MRRVRGHAGAVEMRLPPGDWLVGLAAPGRDPERLAPVTVRDGVVDTIRIAPPGS
jgi:hypothetical protein